MRKFVFLDELAGSFAYKGEMDEDPDLTKAASRKHYEGTFDAKARALRAKAKKCWICGKGSRSDDPWNADHVVGGAVDGALRAAHRSCNIARSNRARKKLVVKFAPGLRPVLKHGNHNQLSHGNRSTGGIDRADMPQIPKKYRAEFLRELTAENVSYVDEAVDPRSLRRTQRAINPENVEVLHQAMVNGTYRDDGHKTIVSSDNKILDGHHRWAAAAQFAESNPGFTLSVTRVDMPMSSLLERARTFNEEHGVQARAMGDVYPVLKSSVVRFVPGLRPVLKHAKHDQKTHGRGGGDTDGMEGGDIGEMGGNNLDHWGIYHLYRKTDNQMKRVYEAEEEFQPIELNPLGRPVAPSLKDYPVNYEQLGMVAHKEYDAAYKDYSKKHTEWVIEQTTNIQSELGSKYLDGSKAGIEKYTNEVMKSDWFVSAFGDGGVVGRPKIGVRDSKGYMGQHTIGMRKGKPVNTIVINKKYVKHEPTILHEIAHHATAVSSTRLMEGHGSLFTRNHVYITRQVIGSEYADGLEKAYKDKGVEIE